MTTGANPPHLSNAPKAGGNPRTLIIGTGMVAASLLSFYYLNRYIQTDVESQRPTWRHRINMKEQANPDSEQPTRIVNASSTTEARPENPAQIPLKGNDEHRGNNIFRSAFSAVAGKASDQDDTERPQSKRVNEHGSTYTKSGSYASGYKHQPQDYEKTP